jgi:hypothetical protein
MCLLIAAFFPGQIYFAAIFPISMCIAGILACLYFALRTSRPALAWAGFAAAFVAAFSYLTAIVMVPALQITGVLVLRGQRRRQAIIPAIGAAAGLGAVLLTMEVAVGIWDAYFISGRKARVGVHMPLETLIDKLRPLWTSQSSAEQVLNATASQTLLTCASSAWPVSSPSLVWSEVRLRPRAAPKPGRPRSRVASPRST